MDFQKYTMDIIALSTTIVFNCALNITVGFMEEDAMIITGLLISPLIGGAVRSSIATIKHQIIIIPAMIVLDIFVFVPLVFVITGWWGEGYLWGMIMGAIAAGIMTIASLVTLAIRYAVESVLKKNGTEEEKQPQEAVYQKTTDISMKPSAIIHCPACHNVLTSTESFCTHCGAKLGKEI